MKTARSVLRPVDPILLVVATALLSGAHCGRGEDVGLREFPYPYEAALAVCSDIDETAPEEFFAIQEFLCTGDSTELGMGLDLEIGNSFWMYNQYLQFLRDSTLPLIQLQKRFPGMPDSGLSWFAGISDSVSGSAILLQRLIAAGFVDCLHSYGHFCDSGFTRVMAARAVRTLKEQGISTHVFINHNTGNPNNMGPGRLLRGDDPDAVEYHADLTIDTLGVVFLWSGRLTHCVGQGGDLSLKNLLKSSYEWVRTRLPGGGLSSALGNELVTELTLDDGHRVFDFVRFISPWGRNQMIDAASLAGQIAPDILDELTENHGYLIVYTHLGRNPGAPYLPQETVRALRELKRRQNDGEIMVTTTSRLLRYYVNRRSLKWHHTVVSDTVLITIEGLENEVEGRRPATHKDLEGMTFIVPPGRPVILVMDCERIAMTVNPPDRNGNCSLSVPRHRLSWPMSAGAHRSY